MTVAVLGAGNVGRALAGTMARAGMTVRLGRREPGGGEGLPAGVTARSHAEAIEGAELIVLAVPAGAALSTLAPLTLPRGTVLVDATNPLRWEDGPVWAPPEEGSMTALLQAAHPDVEVVKALNHFGAEVHAEPGLAGEPADAFVAGRDPEARRRVMGVLDRIGFRSRDAGGLPAAAALENLAVLWIRTASVGGAGRRWVFRVQSAP